jgi:hypothetical protein
MLRTSETPLRALWALLYRVSARVFVACLIWREWRASAYVQIDEVDFLPGLSDVDLVIIVRGRKGAPDTAALRVRRRAWRFQRLRLLKEFPIIDDLRVYEDAELNDLVGSSALTYRLDGRAWANSPPPAYVGHAANGDPGRILTRPGLYTTFGDWRRLNGPERRPDEPARDAQQRRIDAWLELIFWWRMLPRACMDSVGPRPTDVCVKCVAEAVRIWVWLARGERIDGRVGTLRRGLELLPEEEDGLRRVIELRRSLPHWPDSPHVLDETLPLLVRLSTRIAAVIDTEAAAAGFTEVPLVGADRLEPMLAGGPWKPNTSLAGGLNPEILPLADWRGIACPRTPDDTFAPLTADPTDPAAFLTAAGFSQGPYPTLLADRLLIRPGYGFVRTGLRAVACRTTEPVSFALLERRPLASFPNLSGWSVADTARRATAEHRAWLRPRDGGGRNAAGRELGMLLSAVRAALLLESIVAGSPELPLTLIAAGRSLAAKSPGTRTTLDDALGQYRAFADKRAKPSAATLTAMRKLVLDLPAYGSR